MIGKDTKMGFNRPHSAFIEKIPIRPKQRAYGAIGSIENNDLISGALWSEAMSLR